LARLAPGVRWVPPQATRPGIPPARRSDAGAVAHARAPRGARGADAPSPPPGCFVYLTRSRVVPRGSFRQ